ncbi:hypothetical protein AB0P15_30970 [Streptomyces sp. NPDC087917]
MIWRRVVLAGDFAANLDAACAVPGSTENVYLFQGERYVSYSV